MIHPPIAHMETVLGGVEPVHRAICQWGVLTFFLGQELSAKPFSLLSTNPRFLRTVVLKEDLPAMKDTAGRAGLTMRSSKDYLPCLFLCVQAVLR